MQPKPPSPHPTLDQLKAQLAHMTPEERKKAFLLMAQLVKKQVQDAEAKK